MAQPHLLGSLSGLNCLMFFSNRNKPSGVFARPMKAWGALRFVLRALNSNH
jgi:hypothetical protein